VFVCRRFDADDDDVVVVVSKELLNEVELRPEWQRDTVLAHEPGQTLDRLIDHDGQIDRLIRCLLRASHPHRSLSLSLSARTHVSDILVTATHCHESRACVGLSCERHTYGHQEGRRLIEEQPRLEPKVSRRQEVRRRACGRTWARGSSANHVVGAPANSCGGSTGWQHHRAPTRHQVACRRERRLRARPHVVRDGRWQRLVPPQRVRPPHMDRRHTATARARSYPIARGSNVIKPLFNSIISCRYSCLSIDRSVGS